MRLYNILILLLLRKDGTRCGIKALTTNARHIEKHYSSYLLLLYIQPTFSGLISFFFWFWSSVLILKSWLLNPKFLSPVPDPWYMDQIPAWSGSLNTSSSVTVLLLFESQDTRCQLSLLVGQSVGNVLPCLIQLQL